MGEAISKTMNFQLSSSSVVVVTGAEGFLGRQVVARLAAKNHEVVAVDRIPRAGPPLPGVTYHQADLSDAMTLLPASLTNEQPFTLVHLAWDMRRHQGYAIQAEQVRQFAGMLDAWTGKGLARLVAMGSAEEYGGCEGIIREDSAPVLPLSPYGWAKRSAHDLAVSWCLKTDVPVMWLRPFIIYGPGQSGDMMIPYAIDCAVHKRDAKFTDGRQLRDFVFIDDVVEAITLSVTASSSGFHICNIAGGKPVVVADVLTRIARHYKAESSFHLGAKPRRPGEPNMQVAEVSNAMELLGWSARTDMHSGLDRIFKHHHQ